MQSEFKIDIPHEARYILRLLWCNGYDTYIVGGCVRDSLLDKAPHDWDICTSAKPGVVLAIMAECGIKTVKTGLQHGTVTAVMDGGNYEITTFRVDGEYTDNRRPDSVEFVNDINKDLSRRDFTINAMAYSEWDGLVDPWGGYGDLDNKLIRCVGHPDDRFREDALRILRALRFASTYGFKIEEQTAYSIHKNKSLLKNISAERIRDELCKMLCGEGVLDILLEYSDVMAIIIPELESCIDFEQNNPYHKYDVYEHIAHAVAFYKGSDVSTNMALLLHDIGKPECYTEDHNGGHFHGHSVPSAYHAQVIADRLRFDNKTKDEIIKLVLYHDSVIEPTVKCVRRWLNKIGYDLLIDLTFLRIADIMAHSDINRDERLIKILNVRSIAKQIIDEQQCFKIKDLAVNGNDIIRFCGVESGPIVGKVLKHLLDKVIDGEIENAANDLIREAKRYLKGELK